MVAVVRPELTEVFAPETQLHHLRGLNGSATTSSAAVAAAAAAATTAAAAGGSGGGGGAVNNDQPRPGVSECHPWRL